MAKKKLFGNHIDPSCEICALGMVSSDGETVLCRYAGAPEKHHFCKRFRYDPLKRTPRRLPPPTPFTAADFTLIDPAADLIDPALNKREDTDPARDMMRDTLRSYLDTTDSPSVDDILELLAVSAPEESAPETAPSDEAAPEGETPEEKTDAAETDDAAKAVPTEDEIAALEEELLETPETDGAEGADDSDPETTDEAADTADGAETKPTAVKEDDWSHFSPLASEDDIRRDMESLSVERHEGASTRAALSGFSVEFPDDSEDTEEAEEAPSIPDAKDPTLLFDPDPLHFEDDDPILSDDLLFMNLDSLDGETIESLRLNEDGTLSSTTEDL